MAKIWAPEIDEQKSVLGGDGQYPCPHCGKPNDALCFGGILMYRDGSSNRCFNLETEEEARVRRLYD